MVKFGLDNYVVELPEYARNYKQISQHIKTFDCNGKLIEYVAKPSLDNEPLFDAILKHSSEYKSKTACKRNVNTGKRQTINNIYLPLNNLEYEEGLVKEYIIGNKDSSQTMYVRLKFMIGEYLLIISDKAISSGSHAVTFQDIYFDNSIIEEILDDLSESSKNIEDYGIVKINVDEDIPEAYSIMALNSALSPVEIEVEKRDLLRSLIAIEMYKFEQEILY